MPRLGEEKKYVVVATSEPNQDLINRIEQLAVKRSREIIKTENGYEYWGFLFTHNLLELFVNLIDRAEHNIVIKTRVMAYNILVHCQILTALEQAINNKVEINVYSERVVIAPHGCSRHPFIRFYERMCQTNQATPRFHIWSLEYVPLVTYLMVDDRIAIIFGYHEDTDPWCL